MVYSYRNPVTGEIIDVVQGVDDEHRYVDENGLEYTRVFYAPNISIDSSPDITSREGFLKYTSNKKGTLGDLIEKSAEASEIRKSRLGFDPVRQKKYDEYRKKTGKMHREERKEKAQEFLSAKGIELSFD